MLNNSSFFFGTFCIFVFWFLLVLPVVKINLKRKPNIKEKLDYRVKRSLVFEDILKIYCVFIVSLVFLMVFLSGTIESFKSPLVFFLILALIPFIRIKKRKF